MASNSSGLGNRHLLVRDWHARRGQRMQRLGRYLYSARARSGGESIRDVVKQARELGERLNTAKVSQIEQLRDDGPEDADELRNDVSFMAVWFMLRYHGYSLTDFERYALSGEEPGESDEQRRADLVQRAFLALPEPDRRQVEQFVDYLYQQAAARTLDVEATPDDAPRRSRTTGYRPKSANEVARLDSARARQQPTDTAPPAQPANARR